MPFTQLTHFGNAFLTKFEVATMNTPVLEGLTLIDSPGVLSGEKQRINRGYGFEGVVKWFADRVDMILLLFDVNKLDISDEFRRVILSAKGNDNKIHILLNKADRCSTSQLMRVYGAMMWNLGKVVDTPEVARVYIGSFWDQPLANDENRKLFESEETDLYKCLAQLPRGAATRKLNDLIKRARLAKVHAFLLDHLRKSTPMIGKTKKQQSMLDNLEKEYQVIAKERNCAMGDFPDPNIMREKLRPCDFSKFKKLNSKLLESVNHMLSVELPKLVGQIPSEHESNEDASILNYGSASPFGAGIEQDHKVDPEEYRGQFNALGPVDGVLNSDQIKPVMQASGLPTATLHKIWSLAVSAKPPGDSSPPDGTMNLWQFAVCHKLIQLKMGSEDLPTKLPKSMLPSKAALDKCLR